MKFKKLIIFLYCIRKIDGKQIYLYFLFIFQSHSIPQFIVMLCFSCFSLFCLFDADLVLIELICEMNWWRKYDLSSWEHQQSIRYALRHHSIQIAAVHEMNAHKRKSILIYNRTNNNNNKIEWYQMHNYIHEFRCNFFDSHCFVEESSKLLLLLLAVVQFECYLLFAKLEVNLNSLLEFSNSRLATESYRQRTKKRIYFFFFKFFLVYCKFEIDCMEVY